MTTILILGATGSIGSDLVRFLGSNKSLALRALARSEDRAARLRAQGIVPFIGDLDDARSLPPAFEGVDRLWLLTALGPRAPENSMNAVWAARQAGVKHVVRLSAIGAAHDAPTRNGRLHALSDRELMASGIPWTVIKPHFFMQNLLPQVPVMKAQGALYQDLGDGKLAMIDVRDVAEFGAAVLTAPERHAGKTYTITGPAAIGLREVASEFGQALDRRVDYVPVPHDGARQALVDQGVPPWFADCFVEYGAAYEGGWGDFTTSDFESVVGKQATSFAAFLSRKPFS
jgi:uncharacterized protein YbjT (DUF2867 family)